MCGNPTDNSTQYAGIVYGIHLGDHEFRYIGQTRKTLEHRFKRHLSDARSGKGYAVHDWIRKHGEENIRVCILATVQEHELEWLDSLEEFHIAQYRDLIEEKNLNLTDGGDGGNRGYRHTEEARKKMSEARKGKKHSEETKARMRDRRHSEETKAKMSKAHKGKSVSDRAKEVASLTHKGKIVSAETRAKISKSNKGKGGKGGNRGKWNKGVVRSQAFKDNLSAQKRGKPMIAPHVRFHINRNQFKDDCVFCEEEILIITLQA